MGCRTNVILAASLLFSSLFLPFVAAAAPRPVDPEPVPDAPPSLTRAYLRLDVVDIEVGEVVFSFAEVPPGGANFLDLSPTSQLRILDASSPVESSEWDVFRLEPVPSPQEFGNPPVPREPPPPAPTLRLRAVEEESHPVVFAVLSSVKAQVAEAGPPTPPPALEGARAPDNASSSALYLVRSPDGRFFLVSRPAEASPGHVWQPTAALAPRTGRRGPGAGAQQAWVDSEFALVPALLWVGAAFVLLLAALAFHRFEFGAAALAPLFSRFEGREEVLQNERRARLFDHIQAEPGISHVDLCGRTGMAYTSAEHHLLQLERHGLIRKYRDGKTTQYFPQGRRLAPEEALAPCRRQLLELLVRRPGLTAPELSRELGQRVQSTWANLKRLAGAGMLVSERAGRTIRWRRAA